MDNESYPITIRLQAASVAVNFTNARLATNVNVNANVGAPASDAKLRLEQLLQRLAPPAIETSPSDDPKIVELVPVTVNKPKTG